MTLHSDPSNLTIPDEVATRFAEAIQNRDPVGGLTHNFYRYPARFSPLFARAAILTFTKPGEVVFDPFMGGGTTLVEARCVGRLGIGIDISGLADFVSRVKTTVLSEDDYSSLQRWALNVVKNLNLHNPPKRVPNWVQVDYQRNINSTATWRLRKILELALDEISHLQSERQKSFARCALLNAAQWALDCRNQVPSAPQFRSRLVKCIEQMLTGAKEFSRFARNADIIFGRDASLDTLCLNRSCIGVESDPQLRRYFPPKLIVTSPPYPGVHVLYHRWQVSGRKETPAPFWIINSADGNGESFYTFGNRKEKGLTSYYDQLLAAFNSLARICDEDTLIIQMVAFSEPSWQLAEYLRVLEMVGFRELRIANPKVSTDGRLWRIVPNRKWYADQRGPLASSKEVVLLHRLPSERKRI